MKNIIHNIFTGRTTDGIHAHFKLLVQDLQDFIEIESAVYGINDRRIRGKRNLDIGVNLCNLLFDLQVNINQKTLNRGDAICTVIEIFF